MYKKIVIFIGLHLMMSMLYSQEPVDSIATCLEKHFSSYPSELIYFQTSKNIYETGEDLWFKVYQLDSHSFGLSENSKTLYLQMVNGNDSVVWQEKYQVEKGIVSGHIYVDEKLNEGVYSIEGYTKDSFFKNDSTGIIPTRKIQIVKNIARSVVPEKRNDETFRFEMFPEGGYLVSDIQTKMAFKATDGRGNPVFVEGTVFQNGQPLCEMKSTHNGMGTFLFTPLQDSKYRIDLKNGKSYLMPEIHSDGMALRLFKQDKKQLSFIVSQSDNMPKQQIFLVGQMRGKVCCMARCILNNNLRISIPLDNFLYQGIAEFTLFDASMRPIAERLVFIHPNKKLIITAEPEKKSFAIREKATIKIKVIDEDGKPVRAHLGVSVYDNAFNNPANSMNILSYAYLTTQIRGKVFDPGYYFDESNNGRKEGMDLLLLTQGWRRYIWGMEQPVYQGLPFLDDEIQGIQMIKKKKRDEKVQITGQLIQVSGPKGNTLFIWADSIGRFAVSTEMMNELRGGYVYLKPMLSEEFKPLLKLDNLFLQIDSTRKKRRDYYPVMAQSQYNKEVLFNVPVVANDSTILLDEVVVKGKGRMPFRDKFMGRLDSLMQRDFGPWVCKHGWLENYKEGYTHHHDARYCPSVIDDGEPRKVPVIGKRYNIMKAEYYPCGSKGIWCFKPLDYQTVTYQGAIYSEEELLRMNNYWRTKGYYASREFYQPDEVDIKSLIPDARNTLLWAPSVITDENGEATVSFYCSDINTNFLGIVEGVDGAGLLGTARCEFRVLRK